MANKKIFLTKYGLGESVIYIKNNSLYLRSGKKYEATIPVENIVSIVYNKDNEGYFFRVIANGKKNNQFFFDRKYDIKYRASDIDDFIEKIKIFDIKLEPDFGQYGAIYECQDGGIIKYCIDKEKYLLTITKDSKNNMFCLNYGVFDKNMCTKISLYGLNIGKEINNQNTIKSLPEKMHNYVDFGVYILDKNLSFGRGFCLVEVDLSGCNNAPMVFGDDIFYSFDEDEIKNRIIEIFKKHDGRRDL